MIGSSRKEGAHHGRAADVWASGDAYEQPPCPCRRPTRASARWCPAWPSIRTGSGKKQPPRWARVTVAGGVVGAYVWDYRTVISGDERLMSWNCHRSVAE
jgi:hypothetical protein